MRSMIARINATACVLSWLIGVNSPLLANDLHRYVSRSANLARYDLSDWKGPKPAIGGFYPLGFSTDGWFAYVQNPAGDVIESEGGSCTHPPCLDGISLVNIECSENGCFRDTPDSPTDKCWCPMETRVIDLAKFGIKPLENLKHGSFPSMIDGEQYDIRIVTKDNLIPSEIAQIDPATKKVIPEPGSSGAQIFLESTSRGSKLVRTFALDHEGITPGTVRSVGWLRDPLDQRLVIIVAFVNRSTGIMGQSSVTFVPVGANLRSGFQRR